MAKYITLNLPEIVAEAIELLHADAAPEALGVLLDLQAQLVDVDIISIPQPYTPEEDICA
jgi:hypothetical protein